MHWLLNRMCRRNNVALIRQRVISMLENRRAKYQLEGGKIIFSY